MGLLYYLCHLRCGKRAEKEIALLRQNYVSADSYVCVAGVMKMGESAEKTAAREVAEEIGQKAEKITFIRSFPYEKKRNADAWIQSRGKKGRSGIVR